MTRPPRLPIRLLTALLALASLLLAGCDNPACVFSGNCNQSGGGDGVLGTNPATVPGDRSFMRTGAPQIVDVFPSGGGHHSQTPIFISFNESISSRNLSSAFQVIPTGGFGIPITVTPALTANGRVVILVPSQPFSAGTSYDVLYAPGAMILDLEGSELPIPSNRFVGTFGIAAVDPTTPIVMATYPPDFSTGESPAADVVVVFDRPMDAGSIDDDSFIVKQFDPSVPMDPGADPTFDPRPTALATGAGGSDRRVWVYPRADSSGTSRPFDLDRRIEFRLSPPGDRIQSDIQGDDPLAETLYEFDTADFAAPASAQLVSIPTDAIGIDNLSGIGGVGRDLEVAVDLGSSDPDDRLGVFLFGTSTSDVDPRLVALFRQVRLGDLGANYDPVNEVATLTEAELDIASATGPVAVRFANGTIFMAFRLQRGGSFSALKLLDGDDLTPGIQGVLLDNVRPTLAGFGPLGTATNVVSDQRNVTVVGRASEELRAVEVGVTAPFVADNGFGTFTPVVAANDEGEFVAAPIPGLAVDVFDPAAGQISLDVRIFDRALNAALVSSTPTYKQVGVIGPGNALPSVTNITVEVVDARTLAPIVGARVVATDAATPTDPANVAVTNGSGVASVAAFSMSETILTVDAAGYDLFSFHGLPIDRISVPLERFGTAFGRVRGTVSSLDSSFDDFEGSLADSRGFRDAEPTIPLGACTSNPLTGRLECDWGPRRVRIGALGALGFVLVDPPTLASSFQPTSFLRGFELVLPLAASQAGLTRRHDFDLDVLLDDADTTDDELPIAGPALQLFAGSVLPPLDLGDLDGQPRVTVEGRIPGLPGTALVGAGIALEPGGNMWEVRSAIPGVVDPVDGELVQAGTVDPGLLLRVEVRDNDGNRVGRRPDFATANGLSSLGPLDVAEISLPIDGGTAGSLPYDIVFRDAIVDALGQPGLYRVSLRGPSGRSWHLWRIDAADAAGSPCTTSAGADSCYFVTVPDIGVADGVHPGSVTASVEAFAWPELTFGLGSLPYFMFADVDQRHDFFSESEPILYSQP